MNKFLSFLLVLTTVTGLSAQSVDEVLAKYYQATGGSEQWKSLTSMRWSGKIVQMGMELPAEMIMARPNKRRVNIDIQGMKLVDAYDGTTGWMINPFTGGNAATKKSVDESKEAGKQMFENELVDYAAKGHKVSLEGRETVDGVETIVLKLTTKEGDDTFYFFDPENYVPIMTRSFVASGQMKGMAMEQYLSDYQEVCGMMMPFSISTKANGSEMFSMTLEKAECNVPVNDADFAYPGK